MDAMQVHMVSVFIGTPRADHEDWVLFVKRRRRLARDLCSRVGLWSEAWAKRTIAWHEHVMMADGVMRSLVMFKGSDWLEAQRSQLMVHEGLLTLTIMQIVVDKTHKTLFPSVLILLYLYDSCHDLPSINAHIIYLIGSDPQTQA